VGEINNNFPGNLINGTMTKVISPSMVNETIVGYSWNHWGHRVGTGAFNSSDYTRWWQPNVVNPVTNEVGLFPPRIEPFGEYGEPVQKDTNKDEWPYLPELRYTGGDRTNLLLMRPAGSSGPLPKWNRNERVTLKNDLSYTRGRHNFKFGMEMERNFKTEPGSVDYTGQYNFGHSGDNPISTGNGYANALLGIFTTYNERNERIDRDERHWYGGFYAQDSWRLTSRLTLDYGFRMEHHGAIYEARDEHSGFDPGLWSAGDVPILYKPVCRTGVSGDQACSSSNQAAIDPRFPDVFLNRALTGTVVPGVGSIANGQWTNGLAHHPTNPDTGKKDGWYYDYPMWSYAPRVGLAWDVFGDGKTAVRASTGVFYNFVNRSSYGFSGGALVSRVRTVTNSTLNDLASAVAAGNFVESPQNTRIPPGFGLPIHGQQIPQGELEPERNYHVNLAVQRDIGFNTVAEVAYVSNIGRKYWRNKTVNNVPINAYADPNNLFNGEAVAENLLRRDFPGVGSISYLTTDDDILNYNAMQVSVQRRLSRGFQMGLAYTLSKSEGMQGWDFMTEELGGKQALRDRYYGPPAGNPVGVQDGRQDRRHVVVLNYSYMIPGALQDVAVVKHILRDWEASGVSTFM
ncbi:MAG TPA: TonB-dependent receptor, partial [Vicinamibacterales bacterium]|nr:TonB-dependent receptor [Vicinamibacterales bacterium]